MSDVAAYHVFVCALFPVQEGMWTDLGRNIFCGNLPLVWDDFFFIFIISAVVCFTLQIQKQCINQIHHSFSILSDDRSKASSKTTPPYSAIQSLFLQMGISSPVLKVIQ